MSTESRVTWDGVILPRYGEPLVTPARLRATLNVDEHAVPDEELAAVTDAVNELLWPRLTDADHASHANCREAALGMAVQVWQARFSPGGQMMGGEFGAIISPHLLGSSLITRFGGLLATCLRHGGAVIA